MYIYIYICFLVVAHDSSCQSLAKGTGNTWLARPIEVAMLPCWFG